MKSDSRREYTVNIFSSLPEALLTMERDGAEKPAITVYDDSGEKHTRSYGQFAADVRALAAGLKAHDLAGRHIGIAAENCYQWAVAFWGVICGGGVAVALDIENPREAVVKMARHADVAAVFVSQSAAPLLSGAGLPLIYFDQENAILGWQRLLSQGAERPADFPPADAEKMSVIIYTSGTTSAAKAVMLSQRNILHVACHGQKMTHLRERVYDSLPLYHSYSLSCGLITCLTQGQHLCLNGSIKTVLRDMRLFDPDSLLAVPLMVGSLLGAVSGQLKRQGVADKEFKRAQKRYQWSKRLGRQYQPFRPPAVEAVLPPRLRLMFCGGARLNEAQAEDFAVFGVNVVQGYGVSECSPLISVNYDYDNHPASVGRLIADTEIRFSEGEEGEISVKRQWPWAIIKIRP